MFWARSDGKSMEKWKGREPESMKKKACYHVFFPTGRGGEVVEIQLGDGNSTSARLPG